MTTKKQNDLKINVVSGLDLGNGYVKGNNDGEMVSFPSVAAKLYNTTNDPKISADELPDFMSNIINNMDLSFASPLVRDTVRRVFGERAMTSSFSLEEFDVFSRQSKAEVDLSGVLALASIAAHVLGLYWKNYNALPDTTIKANVALATALPIGEFKKHTQAYREAYLNNGKHHTVTFHNFESPLSIEITFDAVYVANEGEAAQYGLMLGGDMFLNMIAETARKRFPNGELDEITGSDLVTAKNTLGIDIGEGTIDFAVFTNGKFNSDASTTFQQGYGNVLESALDRLRNEAGYPYNSRKELSEFLTQTPSVLTRKKWERVQGVVREEAAKFSDQLINEVSKVFSRRGSFVEVVFVYGGGATPLEESLFTRLQTLIAGFGDEQLLPIVYLDSNYSRFLNEHGLYQLAERLVPKN